MQESNNFCASYLTKFSIDLMECGTLLRLVSDEPHSHFLSSIQYSKESTRPITLVGLYQTFTDELLSNLV